MKVRAPVAACGRCENIFLENNLANIMNFVELTRSLLIRRMSFYYLEVIH
jgi:hypothetical protein